MKKTTAYQHKKVLVLGLARSGYAVARLMKELGADVTVNDRKDLSAEAHAEDLVRLGIRVVGGGHPPELVNESTDLLIKNPGIPYTNPLVKKAIDLGIRVITEVEIAYEICPAPFIGVTGSNGKTTTTMLIGEMMKGGGCAPIVAGNIGTALSGAVRQATEEQVVVAELSSFQLLGTDRFHPKIAVVLNLFDHHLDYHGTLTHYAAAKARITANQTDRDLIVYNADSERVIAYIVSQSRAGKIPFSTKKKVDGGAYVADGTIWFGEEAIMNVAEMGLPGEHNLQNALAAVAAAKAWGVGTAPIAAALRSFTGVRHRLQYVGNIGGRVVYNDSKATNILATSNALRAFPGKSIVLLAGGLDRGNGFDALVSHLRAAKIKAVFLFGQTREKLQEACKKAGIDAITIVTDVEEAVPAAFKQSEPGDVILLSPACASWDQYESFEQRGDIFIREVNKFR